MISSSDSGRVAKLWGFPTISRLLARSAGIVSELPTIRPVTPIRVRVVRRHRSKVPCERHVGAAEHAIATGHRQTHALVMGIRQAEAASFHLGCKI
jgi:hypothetical protein